VEVIAMRANIGKAIILGLAVLTACAAGCSQKDAGQQTSDEGQSGVIGLQLQVAPGVTINTVSYAITGNGLNKTGTIDVTNSTLIQALIGGIPTGNNYTISLTATSTDGKVSCAGTATFNVASHATTAVTVHLLCKVAGADSGSISVNGSTTMCPNLDSVSVSPTSASVGSSVAVAAAASVLDPTQTLTYAWTVNAGGSFAAPSAASTTFMCNAAGTSTLTVTVSNGSCSDTASATVTCTGATTDAGATDTGVDAPVDTGSDTGGGVSTQSILSTKGAACLACAQTNGCLPPSCESLTGNAAAGPASGQPKAKLCLDTLQCVVSTKCAASGSGTPCFCGTASGAACLGAGAANGPCLSQETAGLETTDPSAVATGFGDTTKGGGLANALVQCLNDSSCTTCFQ
jgi:hypothetical protein